MLSPTQQETYNGPWSHQLKQRQNNPNSQEPGENSGCNSFAKLSIQIKLVYFKKHQKISSTKEDAMQIYNESFVI